MTKKYLASILIVDDEPDLCESIQFIFDDFDYKTIVAHSVDQAMIQLKSGPIDFVLSDIRLPGKSGIELLKFVQNLPEPRPQVVLLTGFTDLSEEEGLALGAKALIRKPIELEKVFRVIDQLRQSK